MLRDRALKCAQVILNSDPGISFEDFVAIFKTVFNRGSGAEAAPLRLLTFKQGKQSMADYSTDFWILAEETVLGPDALRSTLLNNIREDLKDELIMRDLPTAFDELMSLCIKVDEWLRARRQTRNSSSQEAVEQRGADNEGRTTRPNIGPPGHQRAPTERYNLCKLATPILQLRSASDASRPVSACIAVTKDT